MKKNWYDIQSKASNEVLDVYIFDEIGTFGINAQNFIDRWRCF